MEVPVLIVGGGYAGLSAATMLAWRGVDVMLVERHASTSIQPKAFGVNTRAVELLRPVPGLEEELDRIWQGIGESMRIAIASSLADPAPEILFDTSTAPFPTHLSPAPDLGAPQAEVERVLRRKAEELGADLRFSTELVSLEQDDDGVTALIRADGVETTVRADYVIAADGYRSPIREALAIPTSGKGVLSHLYAIMFDADLSDLVNEREVTLWYLQNDTFTGVFVTGTGVGAHVLGVNHDGETTDFDAVELVRLGVGVPDLDVTVLDTTTFTTAHILADTYRAGRVFLAGDAAHTMPPTGGQGGSTALQDGCDIAWRLWLVISGQAGPSFLDSYDAERRPVGELIADAQLANLGFRMPPAERVDYPEPIEDPFAAILGCRYHSAAILSEPDDDGSLLEDPRVPTGRPGGRAPHVVLDWDGRTISTLDLFGSGFVLLAGPYGQSWVDAGRAVRDQLGVRLAPHRIGDELLDVEGTWLERYGVGKSGAVLVRPDGYIAWRSAGADLDPAGTLESALVRLISLL
ncbi:FAD-dependent oxidoreductase [Nonomuraea sp. NPDC049152]|uniref:FAD-dependent oxidoreductase n=1 Tax=Nonomuraea sp. NPDC049152 TaxID=3154350 RepID=UPI0033ECE976